MTTSEAIAVGKLLAGLVLFGSAGCFILGYGFQAFVFCLAVGAGSFAAGYVIWQRDKEHNHVRILFPITGAAGIYAALFALFYVAGTLGSN